MNLVFNETRTNQSNTAAAAATNAAAAAAAAAVRYNDSIQDCKLNLHPY